MSSRIERFSPHLGVTAQKFGVGAHEFRPDITVPDRNRTMFFPQIPAHWKDRGNINAAVVMDGIHKIKNR